MSPDEEKALLEQYLKQRADYARAELERSADLIKYFTLVAASNRITLEPDNFTFEEKIGIVATAPGLARKLLNISPSERDGLFSFDEIAQRFPPDRFQEGCFVGKDCVFLAHPCYRRGMHPSNNWAPLFTALFWRLDSPDIQKFIAIDENRVRVDVDTPRYVELDTWYGAPFNEDINKIEAGTVKLRPPLDLSDYIESFFAQAYCLDIRWSNAGQIKTFQALEVKTENTKIHVDGQSYFPARYLHAEFDLDTGTFRHFDGAIQLFAEDEYFRRRDSDFNITFKDREHIKARSTKVFKLNGSISVALWVELCCHFFAANPLTFEYFTGSYPKHVADAVSRIRERAQLGN